MKKWLPTFESPRQAFLLLLTFGLLAFAPGLQNPFLFDDVPILADNRWLTW